MARKYFVWKDPACGGVNKVWVELSGREFYATMKLPENKRRHFIRMGNDICPEADIIYIEATKQEYTLARGRGLRRSPPLFVIWSVTVP